MLTRKRIEKEAEKLGWDVEWYENNGEPWVSFDNHAPQGNEVCIECPCKKLSDIVDWIYNEWDNYDPSYEASLWIGNDGHGKNGAPYEMGDVYKDMCDSEDMIYDLYSTLNYAA